MKLFEAYEIMRAPSDDFSRSRVKEARNIVYREIRDCGERKANITDDAIQETFINLIKRGEPLTKCTDDKARALINRALSNAQSDQYRKSTKERKNKNKEAHQKVAPSRFFGTNDLRTEGPFDEWDGEVGRFDDADSPEEFEELIYAFLSNDVLQSAISRSPARERARQAITQMRDIDDGSLSFDELIDDNVGTEASERERKRERDKIHKRHQRTRERLREWLDEEQTDSSGEGYGLSDTEFKLLYRAVETLRSRQSAGD